MEDVPISMLGFLRNTNNKLIVGLVFVLFVPASISIYDKIYTIDVLRGVHSEIILMRSVLTFGI